jgi:hypothetical protein
VPLNDTFATAEVLTSTSTSGDMTTGYSVETGEPNVRAANKSAWFIWQPKPADNGTSVQIDTIGITWDAYLDIYSSTAPITTSFAGLTHVTDAAAPGFTCTFTVDSSLIYYVQLQRYYLGATGLYTLNYPLAAGAGPVSGAGTSTTISSSTGAGHGSTSYGAGTSATVSGSAGAARDTVAHGAGTSTTVTGSVGAATSTSAGATFSGAATSTTVSGSTGDVRIATAHAVGLSYTGTRSSGYARVASTVDPTTAREPYRLIVVDMWGTRYAELEKALVKPVVWNLNGQGLLTFTLPADDPKLAHCKKIVREVQLWRGAQFVEWFVIVKRLKSVGSLVCEIQCATLDWHLGKRFIAPPPAFVELLVNPDFELGGLGWVPSFDPGSVPPLHPYHDFQRGRVETGAFALRLGGLPLIPGSDPALAAGHGQYMAQTVIYANPEHAKEEVSVKLSARCYVESYASKSHDGWGLHLEAFHPFDMHSIGFAYSSIDEKTPVGRWIDQSCELKIPNDGIYYRLVCKLYPPGGFAVWDFAHLYADETVHFYDADPAIAVLDLVDWAQSTILGKSTLNLGTDCPPSGTLITKTFRMAERIKVDDGLRGFATIDNGVEWDVQCTPTTRTVTTYAPRKGTDTDVVLALGSNVLDYGVQDDGDVFANTVVMQQDGHERSASATASMGGMVVEQVLQARPGSSLGTLQLQADRAVARLNAVDGLPTLAMDPRCTPELLDRVHVGDRVRVDVPTPLADLMGVQARITQITLDPSTDQLTYVPTLEPS